MVKASPRRSDLKARVKGGYPMTTFREGIERAKDLEGNSSSDEDATSNIDDGSEASRGEDLIFRARRQEVEGIVALLRFPEVISDTEQWLEFMGSRGHCTPVLEQLTRKCTKQELDRSTVVLLCL